MTTRGEHGDALGLLAGSGILLIQAAAVIPGLLPVLLLMLPFVLPLVALGLVAAVVVGVPVGAWRLGRRLVQPRTAESAPGDGATSMVSAPLPSALDAR